MKLSLLNNILDFVVERPIRSIQFIKNQIIPFYSKIYYHSKNFFNSLIIYFQNTINEKNRSAPILKNINGIKFIFDFNLDQQVLFMFFGLYQIETINVMLKYLKKGSTFGDVGANIGYLSAIVASIVSKRGEIHSFEPVPDYFYKLKKFSELNSDYKIYPHNFALGDHNGLAEINTTKLNNIGENSIVPNKINKLLIKETFQVKIKKLDEYLFENNLKNISLIKIDVKGYEFPVLMGLSNYFHRNRSNLPPIIVEITPKALPLLGYSLKDFNTFLDNFSYKAYTLDEKHEIKIESLNYLNTKPVDHLDLLLKQV